MKEKARRKIRKTVGLSTDTPAKDSDRHDDHAHRNRSDGIHEYVDAGSRHSPVVHRDLGDRRTPWRAARSQLRGELPLLREFHLDAWWPSRWGRVLSWFIAKTFRSMHKYPTQTYLKALPIGLGIALACVIVSRVDALHAGLPLRRRGQHLLRGVDEGSTQLAPDRHLHLVDADPWPWWRGCSGFP
jgi:hypothetical protein